MDVRDEMTGHGIGGVMKNRHRIAYCALAFAAASPIGAQFSPKDLKEIQAKISQTDEAKSVNDTASLKYEVSQDQNISTQPSADSVCVFAKQASVTNSPFPVVKTDMAALYESAKNLPPDKKDQFETEAQYEARQIARRNAWVGENRFFVLPTPINSGADVYNAETQTYILGPAAPVNLTPPGWDRYSLSDGIVGIRVGNKFPEIEAVMDAQNARQFFEEGRNYENIYVVTPISPYVQGNSSYSYISKLQLLTSLKCRFVRRKSDQQILYYSSP